MRSVIPPGLWCLAAKGSVGPEWSAIARGLEPWEWMAPLRCDVLAGLVPSGEGGDRETDLEGRSGAGAIGVGSDVPAVEAGDSAGNGQADAGSAGAGPFTTKEPVKHRFEL